MAGATGLTGIAEGDYRLLLDVMEDASFKGSGEDYAWIGLKRFAGTNAFKSIITGEVNDQHIEWEANEPNYGTVFWPHDCVALNR